MVAVSFSMSTSVVKDSDLTAIEPRREKSAFTVGKGYPRGGTCTVRRGHRAAVSEVSA
jgi:hypothetical protein